MTAVLLKRLTPHRHYPANPVGRDFFVGDLHGKYALLKEALHQIEFDFNRDRLFSVGDLIDRGEDPFHCLLLAQESWFMPVLGNHEQFLLEFADSDIHAKIAWYQNGGEWWEYLPAQGRALAKKIIEENFALTLSVATPAGRVGVVHGQYPLDNWPLAESDLSAAILYELLWSRDCLTYGRTHPVAGIDFIVSGHTPLSHPLLQGKQLFIDTGCGHCAGAGIVHPHLTVCEFKKEQIELYALTEQSMVFSTMPI